MQVDTYKRFGTMVVLAAVLVLLFSSVAVAQSTVYLPQISVTFVCPCWTTTQINQEHPPLGINDYPSSWIDAKVSVDDDTHYERYIAIRSSISNKANLRIELLAMHDPGTPSVGQCRWSVQGWGWDQIVHEHIHAQFYDIPHSAVRACGSELEASDVWNRATEP